MEINGHDEITGEEIDWLKDTGFGVQIGVHDYLTIRNNFAKMERVE